MRAVIADDSVLGRGHVSPLRDDTRIDVAAQVLNAEELLREVDDHRPDVAIVDIRMPPDHAQEGILAAHEIRERHPGVGIVILSNTSTSGRRHACSRSVWATCSRTATPGPTPTVQVNALLSS